LNTSQLKKSKSWLKPLLRVVLGIFIFVITAAITLLFNSTFQTYVLRRITVVANANYGYKISFDKVHVTLNKSIYIKNLVLCGKNNDTIIQADITCQIQNWNVKAKTLKLRTFNCKAKQLHALAYADGSYNFDLYLNSSKNQSTPWLIDCKAFNLNMQNIDVIKQLHPNLHTTKLIYKTKQLNCEGHFEYKNNVRLQLYKLALNGSNFIDIHNVNGAFTFYSKGLFCKHANIKTAYSEIQTDTAHITFDNLLNASFVALKSGSYIDLFELDSVLNTRKKPKHTRVQIEGNIKCNASKIISTNLQAIINPSNFIKGGFEILLDSAYAVKKAELNSMKAKAELNLIKNYISDSLYTVLDEWIGNLYQFTGDVSYNRSQLKWDGILKTNYVELKSKQNIHIDASQQFQFQKGTLDITNYDNAKKSIHLSPSHVDILNLKGDSKNFILDLNGTLNALKIQTLQVQSLQLNALSIHSNSIQVEGAVVDSHVNSEFSLNYNTKSSKLNAKLDFNSLNLHAYLPYINNSDVAGHVMIDGTYKNVHGFELQIEMNGLHVLPSKSTKRFEQFLDIKSNANFMQVDLKTGMLHGDITWKGNNISEFCTRFLQSVYIPDTTVFKKLNSRFFNCGITFHSIDFLTQIIEPLNPLVLSAGSKLKIKIEEGKQDNYIQFKASNIEYNTLACSALNLQLMSNFNARISAEALKLPFNQTLTELNIESQKHADKGSIKTRFNQEYADSICAGVIESLVYFHDDQVNFNIEALKFVAFNQIWNLKQSSNGWYNQFTFGLNNFNLEHNNQILSANGIYGNLPGDSLLVSLNNFQLQNLNPYLKPYYLQFSGVLNSRFNIYKRYNTPQFDASIICKELQLNATSFGDLKCHFGYNDQLDAFQGQGWCFKNNNPSLLQFNAIYKPTSQTLPISLTYSVNDLPTTWLNPYFTEILRIYHTDINGIGGIQGPWNKLETWGAFDISASKKNRISIDFTNVMYVPISGKIILSSNAIKLENLMFSDTVTTTKPCGALHAITTHSDFTFDKINLNADFKNAMVLNTSRIQNELYYGTVFGTGNFKIAGSLNRMDLMASIENDPLSQFVFNSDAYTSGSDLSFVTFKSNTLALPKFKPSETFSFLMNFKVNKELANRFYIDQSKRDFIKFNGHGDLKLNYSHEGEFTMNGEYTIDDGGYNYKIEEVIDKPFQLVRGSKMTWNGDPMNGIITATATNADYCSIAPLINDSTITSRVPTECQIVLNGTMMKPDIRFKLEFKNLNSNIKSMVDNIMSDETELNRQVFSYLMFKSFVKPQLFTNSGGGITAQNAAATSGSELLSQRLNNMLNKSFGNILKDLKLGVNYRPINQNGSKDAFDFSINKNFFNNRLNIDGEFGYNRTDSRLSNSLIGDVNIEYRLHPEGNLKLKGFNRTNDITQITTTGGPYTQGIGLFYLKEIETRRKSKATKK